MRGFSLIVWYWAPNEVLLVIQVDGKHFAVSFSLFVRLTSKPKRYHGVP